MNMVFCRGCGKEIHETAILCPHCGYQYSDSALLNGKTSVWMAVVSSILALVSSINWFSISTWDESTKGGLWLFSTIAIALSSISLSQKHRGKIFNFISIGVSVLTISMLLGTLNTKNWSNL